MPTNKHKKILYRQGLHLFIWFGLGGVFYIAARHSEGSTITTSLGLTAFQWAILSWILAALHQGWVWLLWRTELHAGAVSKRFGPRGFLIFRVGFTILVLARLLPIIPISLATRGTLPISPYLTYGLIILTTPFILWGIVSVFAYFGASRAFGADHFDENYRRGSLEKRGLFKYIQNSMYTVVLLMLYHPGLLLHSELGLMAAAVHHLFIWTHYYCTEKPDMKEIYG